MKKTLLFDVDGTIAYTNKGITSSVLQEIKRLSSSYNIGFVSGKPIQYLYGLVREAGLTNIFLIGENGGSMVYPSTLPPETHFVEQHEYEFLFKNLKDKLKDKYGDRIFLQPTDTSLSFFVSKDISFSKFAEEFKGEFDLFGPKLKIYEHKKDRAIDAVPMCIDKKTGIKKTLDYLGFHESTIYAFGNGENDIPMLEMAKKVFIVGDMEYTKQEHQKLTRVNKIEELTAILSSL